MRTWIVGLLLPWAALGCSSSASGSAATHEGPPAASAGEETSPAEPEPIADEAPVDEPEPPLASGPASVTLTAVVADQPVPADVRVLDESGKVASEGAAGDRITLPAGNYQMEISIRDAAALADRPTQKRALLLKPGDDARLEARFRWAKVTLNVLVGGRAQAGANVKLLRDGEVVAEMKSGAPPAAITPGRYEADVSLKGTVIRVKGLQFPEGATQTVPVRVQF
jgi:hypothetical protein